MLFAHQVAAVETAKTRPRFAFWWSCGAGKSRAILAILADRPMRTLILAPKSILKSAWMGDAAHFPSVRGEVVMGTAGQQRTIIENSDADFFVTNYAAFKRHAPLYEAVGVRRLVVDESSVCKNSESQQSRLIYQFSRKCEEVYLLSGTPAPNNGTEYYGQLRCLDHTIAPTFFNFAYRYFVPKKRAIFKGGKRREVIEGWTPRQDRTEAFESLLKKWGHTLRKEDCLDLPPTMDRVVWIDLSDDEEEAYRSAVSELRILGKKINAEASTIKLRQIVNGTVRLEGETEEIGSSKLDALSDVLDEIGTDSVVLWGEFTADIDRMAAMMEKRGDTFDVLDGRTSSRAGEMAERFQSGKTQRIICHPQAAGHGITFTRACHDIHFGVGWSYELHAQKYGRLERFGQKRPVTHHLLLSSGTLEEKMLEVVRGKGTAAEALRDLLAEG